MTTNSIDPIELEGFSCWPREQGHLLVLEMRGEADLAASNPLRELLEQVHAFALESARDEIVIDLTELEFMNSSSFKAFVTWIVDLVELPEAQRYKLRFRSNPMLQWQRRSMKAIAIRFCPRDQRSSTCNVIRIILRNR